MGDDLAVVTATTPTRIEAWLSGVVSLRLSTMTPDQQRVVREAVQLYYRGMRGEKGYVCFALESEDWLHVPRGWYWMHGAEYPFLRTVDIREGRSNGTPLPQGTRTTVTFGQDPYPSGQPAFIQAIVDGCRRASIGGLAQAPTRSGKTLCAIEAACRRGGSTGILVDRELLDRQWMEAIEKHVRDVAGRPVPVGLIRGDRFDLPPQHPFVVGMLQTIARRPLDDTVRQAFRTVVLDEADIAPCETALAALRRFSAHYTIGLSATPDRKDGLGQAIQWMIGPTIAELRRDIQADVWFRPRPWRACKVPTKAGDKMRAPMVLRGTAINANEVEKALLRDEEHVADVAQETARAVAAGRQVLILVGLRDHARVIADACKALGLDARLFMGGASDKTRMKGNPVVATYGVAAKGGDFQPPPTLAILAAPRSDVRQAMGRALQPQAPHKPMILDYVYSHPALVKQAHKRRRQYVEKQFDLRNGVTG